MAWTTYSRSETCSDGSAMVQRTDDALAATTTTTRTSSTEVGEGKMQLQGCALHGCNGAFTSDTSCSCDSSCTLFDDCCSDYAHVCLGETTTTAAPTTTTTTTTTTTSELEEAAGGDIVPEGCTAVNGTRTVYSNPIRPVSKRCRFVTRLYNFFSSLSTPLKTH